MKHIFTSVSRMVFSTIGLLFITTLSFTQGFSPKTQNRLQELLDSIQNSAANPVVGGISVAINVDGLAEWKGATGFAARNVDAENNLLPGGMPMHFSTLSHIYSVSKTFTAPLVLELAREGYFSLEDPVLKFIPMLNTAINPGLDGTVTIRQLLAHESGWSDYQNEQMISVLVAMDPARKYTPYEVLAFVHQQFPKGTMRRYSSSNYIALGAIIEVATQKPVEQHFRERFFQPLGLESMFLSVREHNVTNRIVAAPHDNFYPLNQVFEMVGSPLRFPFAFTNVSAMPFTAIHSMAFTGGGIVSDATDVAKWGNALFGGRATSASTLQAMLNSISSTPDPDGDYLGYGVYTNKRVSTTDYFIGHTGRAPGYRSIMFYQPDRKMTIAVLTNFSGLDTRLGGLSPYDVARILYAALPNFIEKKNPAKEAKIIMCFNGKTVSVDRSSALGFIRKGYYLGSCNEVFTPPVTVKTGMPAPADGFTVFPNPFSQSTSIQYQAAASGNVEVTVLDFNGKQVAKLYSGPMEKGAMRKWQLAATHLPAGTYYCRVQGANGVMQQKIVLIK